MSVAREFTPFCGTLSQRGLLVSIRPKISMPAVLVIWLTVTQAELAVSSIAVTEPSPVLIVTTHGGMAMLSWPG